MLDKKQTTLAELSIDYEYKRKIFEYLGMMNTSTDPEERAKQTIAYHQADADVRKAWNELEKAKQDGV